MRMYSLRWVARTCAWGIFTRSNHKTCKFDLMYSDHAVVDLDAAYKAQPPRAPLPRAPAWGPSDTRALLAIVVALEACS
jgi:hypothetical protein